MMLARACAAFAIVVTVTSALSAQGASGDVQGIVVTGAGEPVAGVTVTITDVGTRAAREVITGADGAFAVPGVPAGVYEVQASHQRFATRRQSPFPVYPGRAATLRLELAPAPDPETIMLAGAAPMLERTRAHASSVIDATAIEYLPVQSRNVLELAALAPGSASACDSFTDPSCAERTRVVVDGADRTGTTVHAVGNVSQEAAASMTVSTHPFPAEYGRTRGPVAGIVTKSGATELAGTAFVYRGATGLSSATALEDRLGLPKGVYSLYEFGGSIGGRLADGHHAFGMYDRRRESALNRVVLAVPAAPERLARFAASWERPDHRDEFLAKTTHVVSDDHHLALEYHHRRTADVETGAFASRTVRDAAAAVESSARSFTAAARSTFGQTLFNEARVQIARGEDTAASYGSAPRAVIRAGGSEVLRIGGSPFTGESAVGRLQLADTLTLVRSRHTLRAGFDLLFDDADSAVAGNFGGTYTFNTPAGFDRGVPGAGDLYTQTFERPGTPGRAAGVEVRDVAVFAQDEWAAGPGLTVNVGVRYDTQTFSGSGGDLPETGTGNVAPRLGAAWSPSAVPFVVRAAYGLTYGRTPWPLAAAALAYNGANLQTVTLPGSSENVPRFPARLAAAPASARGPIVMFETEFERASTHHASVGVDWEWMPNTALAVSYLFARGSGLPRAVERGTPGGRAIVLESTAELRYDGLAVELIRRFSQAHQYRLSYTLGRAEDTRARAGAIVPETEADRAIAPAAALEGARRPADHDRRHRFAGTLIYDSNRIAERYDGLVGDLLSDWTFSGIYTVRSGLPYSAYVAGDLDGDGNRFNDLAPGTARNENRRRAFASADVRLARDIALPRRTKLTLLWEAFNLLNRANELTVDDTVFGVSGSQLVRNPLFGEMVDQAEPRRMRLAVRVTF